MKLNRLLVTLKCAAWESHGRQNAD